MTLPAIVAELERLLAAGTAAPWFDNSYSCIFGEERVPEGEYMALSRAAHITIPEPRSLNNPAYVAWCEARRKYVDADPCVASVPAEYGDTATGRHAADMALIVALRNHAALLLAAARENEAMRKVVEWYANDQHYATGKTMNRGEMVVLAKFKTEMDADGGQRARKILADVRRCDTPSERGAGSSVNAQGPSDRGGVRGTVRETGQAAALSALPSRSDEQ